MKQCGEKHDFESVHGARGEIIQEGKLSFHFTLEEGRSSGNKREIETETSALLHGTECKEMQEIPLNVRHKINIPVNNKEEKKILFYIRERKKGWLRGLI